MFLNKIRTIRVACCATGFNSKSLENEMQQETMRVVYKLNLKFQMEAPKVICSEIVISEEVLFAFAPENLINDATQAANVQIRKMLMVK